MLAMKWLLLVVLCLGWGLFVGYLPAAQLNVVFWLVIILGGLYLIGLWVSWSLRHLVRRSRDIWYEDDFRK